ncbi:MAG: PucR family transcriptional regulator, partial [Clostridia bacterium]|nr:PucR family transcriptional regulator [Clostridia bacterium]
MSNRLFQGVIYQLKDAVDRVIGVIDDTGIVISCSELSRIGEARQGVREELTYASDVVIIGGYTYRALNTATKSEYVVFVEGEDKQADRISLILSISLMNIKNLYDDKHDKSSFIKNIILDNILPSDIYAKSKELHFANDVSRIVFLIKFNGRNDIIPYDVMQNMFPGKNKDYVINVGEHDSVLVKEIRPNYDLREIEEIARGIADTISSEFYTKVSIGIG